MIKQIISAGDYERRAIFKKDGDNFLNISEFYYDTIQGEGIYTGHPAAFLRLQGCLLKCKYCDTKEVWKHGSQYTFTELFDLMSDKNIIEQLRNGQHLVITGGSPLLQQDRLIEFFRRFQSKYEFWPFVEIENECVLMPDPALIPFIDCWNNSPKLGNSGISFMETYQPNVIKVVSSFPNSWFKFVILEEIDWIGLETCFLTTELIAKNQVILMPQGATRAELVRNRELVVNLAIEQGVRYSDRLHIQLWDRRVGA